MGGQEDGPALERVWVIPHNELENDLENDHLYNKRVDTF